MIFSLVTRYQLILYLAIDFSQIQAISAESPIDRCIFVGVWMTVKLLGPVATGRNTHTCKMKEARR